MFRQIGLVRFVTIAIVAALLGSSAARAVAEVRPQVTVQARFVEVTDAIGTLEQLRSVALAVNEDGANAFHAVLTPSKSRALIECFEAQKGVDVLSAPKITTLNGRQAQIKIVEVRYIRTGMDLPGLTNAPQTEPFEVGPTLDVIPVVRPDTLSMDLTVIATVHEFVGYDLSQRYIDSGPPKPLTPAPIREYLGERNSDPVNSVKGASGQAARRAIFRFRQAQGSAGVWDGQTLVLGLPIRTEKSGRPNLRFTSKGKACFLFVTPVLIDDAGNRLNDESTLPFSEETIPEQ